MKIKYISLTLLGAFVQDLVAYLLKFCRDNANQHFSFQITFLVDLIGEISVSISFASSSRVTSVTNDIYLKRYYQTEGVEEAVHVAR